MKLFLDGRNSDKLSEIESPIEDASHVEEITEVESTTSQDVSSHDFCQTEFEDCFKSMGESFQEMGGDINSRPRADGLKEIRGESEVSAYINFGEGDKDFPHGESKDEIKLQEIVEDAHQVFDGMPTKKIVMNSESEVDLCAGPNNKGQEFQNNHKGEANSSISSQENGARSSSWHTDFMEGMNNFPELEFPTF